jgi:hypothetical protein
MGMSSHMLPRACLSGVVSSDSSSIKNLVASLSFVRF